MDERPTATTPGEADATAPPRPGAGRFAPSPTGELHLGNLRTALVAWLAARSTGREFVIRMEDLDRVTSSADHERRQLDDLAAIGLDWDGQVVRQSERFGLYHHYIEQLVQRGHVYRCYCTRREIRREIEAAASAPHGLPDGAYPGTCRDLTEEERAQRENEGRRPALRLRTGGERIDFVDRALGPVDGLVDDVVLARADGVPAYNLAVVVDDAHQGIDQIVRGDDLASSTPRQILLQRLFGFAEPEYLHVALVVGADGQRLAKRHGAVTRSDLVREGWSDDDIVASLARSLGLAAATEPSNTITPQRLVDRFDPGALPADAATLADLQRARA